VQRRSSAASAALLVAIETIVSRAFAAARARRWEYKAAHYPCTMSTLHSTSEDSVGAILRIEDKAGWELVTMLPASYPNVLFVFRRLVP